MQIVFLFVFLLFPHLPVCLAQLLSLLSFLQPVALLWYVGTSCKASAWPWQESDEFNGAAGSWLPAEEKTVADFS